MRGVTVSTKREHVGAAETYHRDVAAPEDPRQGAREDPREDLERELYWARGEESAGLTPTSELRARLEEIAETLHRQWSQAAPWGDPLLTGGSGIKRRLKIFLFRALRPISRRYDRITAELASIGVGLADRLARAEDDLRRQEEELALLSRRMRELQSERESTP
jgi:hypothetical protein